MSEIIAPPVIAKPAEEFRVSPSSSARAPAKKHFWRRLFQGAAACFCTFVTGTALIEATSNEEVKVAGCDTTIGHSKWNPSFWLGNLDEPLPPKDFRPNESHRMFRWRMRNPLHNFTFYIIGIADRDFTRVGRYPGDVFNPHDGWNWAVCKYGWVRLPFVSYQNGRFSTYLGWRERGNFGIKLRYHREKETVTALSIPSSS